MTFANTLPALALSLGACIGLTGCLTSVNPMGFMEEPTTLPVTGGEFIAMRTGCTIKRGEFVDKSGKGNSSPRFKFIAVNGQGKTIGEWVASCQAVAPNGRSDCQVSTSGSALSGDAGGLKCPDFKNLQMSSSR